MKPLSLLITLIVLLGRPGIAAPNPCNAKIGSHAAVTPVSRTDPDWWMPRHRTVLNRIAQGNVDLLMIGDSIMHSWENSNRGKRVWEKYYAPRNAVNLGFGGDRTEHVLWRLQNGEIDNINPKLAVLLIGTNNSNGSQYTAEQIADGIKAIVCTLRRKLPDTKVLILSIFPRGDAEKNKDKVAYTTQWAKNDKASKLASEIADGEMVFFLNINKRFLNEHNELTREIMPDLLHPNEKGYQIWAEAMDPTIVRIWGKAK